MLAVSLRMLAGHYHATPWGRHVNEGEVEWPPSPWRLLRALLATWHMKATSDVEEPVMRRLVSQLSEVLPEYHVPAVSLSHTRHYMPLYNSCRDEKTAKVFDTFACIDPNTEAFVVWPGLTLGQPELQALEILLTRTGYLGRAESWVEAGLVYTVPPADFICRPLNDCGPAEGNEVVRLLAPTTAQSLSAWLARMRPDGSTRGKRQKISIPLNIWDALHVDTGELRSAGWSDPPGARWALYERVVGACDVRPTPTRIVRKAILPRVARFAVTSAVPPPFVNGLTFAEKLHATLVRKSCDMSAGGAALPVFSGQEEGRTRIGHRHVYLLWEANDPRRRRVTHVTLYAPEGFSVDARRVLEWVRTLYARHDVQLVLLGVGQPDEFAGTNLLAGQCPLFAASRVWVSRTPFVATRHPKSYADGRPKLDAEGMAIGSPEHDLTRLLMLSGRPRPTVEALPSIEVAGRETRSLEFRTSRYGGEGRRGPDVGHFFRLEFPQPVSGPIALGYGAHFGLGVFWPGRINPRKPQ